MTLTWPEAYDLSRAADTLDGYCTELGRIWAQGPDAWEAAPPTGARKMCLGLAFATRIDVGDVCGCFDDTARDAHERRERVRAARAGLMAMVQSLRASGLLQPEEPEQE